MKLVPPWLSGRHLSGVPMLSRTIGRPSGPISFAQFEPSMNGLPTSSLPGLAVERVEEPVPVGDHHDLADAAGDRQIRLHRHMRRVPVVDVVRRELVVPAQPAGVGVERHAANRYRDCRRPIVAVVIGIRIAGAVVHEIQRRDRSCRSPRPRRRRAPPTSGSATTRCPARPDPESCRTATRARRSARRRRRCSRGSKSRRRRRR